MFFCCEQILPMLLRLIFCELWNTYFVGARFFTCSVLHNFRKMIIIFILSTEDFREKKSSEKMEILHSNWV